MTLATDADFCWLSERRGNQQESALIEVELSAAEIPIEPGGTAQLTVTVTNRQEHDDHISLDIEGVDVEWYALPVPTLNIPADASQSARVLFKIPRSSGSRAETYPFLVRARGMEAGATGVQQATLIVKPFSSLQVEVEPKRAVATYLHHAPAVEVTVSNLGNHPDTLDLYASDPDDGCTYEFEPERVSVPPGHTATTTLRVEPKTRPVLGTGRLYGYTVTARSVEDSFVSSTAHGQLERRALIPALLAAVLLLAAIAAALFVELRPRPVALLDFAASAPIIIAGDQVTLSWRASNVQQGYIVPGNIPVTSSVGSVAVKPTATTDYKLVVEGGGQQASKTVSVAVNPAPTPAAPRITSFSASQTRVHEGETVTLQWTVQNATEILLNPINAKNDARIYTSQQVTPMETTTYKLAASGPGGTAMKSLSITVVPLRTSIAEIEAFHARPTTITTGDSTTLSWKTSGAATVQIDPGVGTNLKPHDSVKVSPATTTTYTLTATDNKGNPVTKTVTVTVNPAPPPTENPETGAPAGVLPNNPPPPGGAGGGTSPPGGPGGAR